jgi:hypothetical protein
MDVPSKAVIRGALIPSQNLPTRSNNPAPNLAAIFSKAISAPLRIILIEICSSVSSSSTPLTVFLGFSSFNDRIPSLVGLKIGLMAVSWHRKVKRFLTTLSDGLAPLWLGEPQNSMRAAAELDERDWRI